MTTNEIKAFLALRGLTVTEIAREIGEHRTAVAKVLSYARGTARIRKKLRRKYRGLQFDDRHLGNSEKRRAA